jgi:hypothetical protein
MNLLSEILCTISNDSDPYYFKPTFMDYIGLSSGWQEIFLFSFLGMLTGAGIFFGTTFLLRRYSNATNSVILRYAISFTLILTPLILILMIFGLLYLVYR